jgi:hypothetical protein
MVGQRGSVPHVTPCEEGDLFDERELDKTLSMSMRLDIVVA